jgi:phage gp36-like protein
MPFYITLADIEPTLPRGFLEQVTKNDIGKTKEQIVNKGIEDAEKAFHSQIGGRYSTPLDASNETAIWCVEKLAAAYIADRLSATSDEWENIHSAADEVWSYLKDIRRGKSGAAIPGLTPSVTPTQEFMSESNRTDVRVAFANHRGEGGQTLDTFGVTKYRKQPFQ